MFHLLGTAVLFLKLPSRLMPHSCFPPLCLLLASLRAGLRMHTRYIKYAFFKPLPDPYSSPIERITAHFWFECLHNFLNNLLLKVIVYFTDYIFGSRNLKFIID